MKNPFIIKSSTMIQHPNLFLKPLIARMVEERKGWPQYEIIFFDQGKELYRDVLSARSQIEAMDTALEYAQVYVPGFNRIHVNPLGS